MPKVIREPKLVADQRVRGMGSPKSLTSFASRMSNSGTLSANVNQAPSGQTLPQQVISTALGGKSSALTNMVTSLGSTSAAVQLAQRLEQIHTFALQNAIFDAGNAPVVERDNSA